MPGNPPDILFDAVSESFDAKGDQAVGMIFVYVAEGEERLVRASEDGFTNGGQGRIHAAAKTGSFDSKQVEMTYDDFLVV